jgi:hypothetical protein
MEGIDDGIWWTICRRSSVKSGARRSVIPTAAASSMASRLYRRLPTGSEKRGACSRPIPGVCHCRNHGTSDVLHEQDYCLPGVQFIASLFQTIILHQVSLLA